MTTIVVNGAPHVVDLYTKDSSIITALREPEAIPQHLPKIYLFAERGSEKEWLGAGSERNTQYGVNTFDERSKFFNHVTNLSNVVNRLGNKCMYKRVIPQDAGPEANFCLWLDLLETTVDVYERNTDGSIKTVAGSPVITGTTAGYKYKIVKTFETDLAMAAQKFGVRTQIEGDQIDPLNPANRSIRYPILEMRVNSRGAWGTNIGTRFWGLDSRIDAIPEKMVKAEKAFPYKLQIVERDTRLNSVKQKPTVLNDPNVLFTFKPFTVDPTTDKELYLGTVYGRSYSQTDSRYPIQEADLSGLAIYQNNIDEIVGLLHTAEAPHIDPEFYDFTASGEDKYLFNFLSGTTMSGYAYHSYVPVDAGVTLNRYETVYAGGGSDGTISNEVFEQLVIAEVRRYADDYDEIQDKAYHVESHLYDSGFTLDTKMELTAFIALRGDTFVTFGTFQEGERSFDNSEELSIAHALKARLSNLPESIYFGTQVLRAGIYGGDCELRGSRLSNRVSTVMEVAHKRAKYMGASEGGWKTGMQYDQGAPGSMAEITTGHSKLWVPVKVRYRFWDAGLNWWSRYDRSQVLCPAFRTVYPEETSVLTADTVAMAIIQLNKINDRSWRAHTGTTGQSDKVFEERVNQFIANQVRDKFDNRFPIEPACMVTESDKARGSISWHSRIKLFADPMRTVAINYTEVFRNNA